MPENLIFQSEYQKLNPEQKTAVDTIEGPVMVIAGAGTGKTQTIALRIANILSRTQTPPQSILCLTFTDTAVNAMRSRLVKIIGPSAYSVRLHTFHSFCNEVIQSHPEYFVFAKDIEPLDDLEKIEIVNFLIDELPNGALLRPWGDHYFYQRDILSSIQTLKRENVSPDDLKKLIEDQEYLVGHSSKIYDTLKSLRMGKDLETEVLSCLAELINLPDLSPSLKTILTYHQTSYQAGVYAVGTAKNPAINLKNALLKYLDNLSKDIPKQKEMLVVYRGYQELLVSRGRYDFDDMILFVLRAFKDNNDLLLQYQEQYQYFLVDEFQDTNSAQNQILNLLGSYFDRPNLFVVGDDDQSIFRFQGASIENIYEFYLKYQPHIIVLKNNYRSHQLILDSSDSVISRNQNRIANYIKDIDKSLKSVKTVDPDPINLIVTPTLLEENYFVVQKIKSLVNAGAKPGDIAILYRNNADITDVAEMLTNEGIKFYLPLDQNVLESRHIQQLINLLSYIDDPTRNELVYHILASDYFGINNFDLLTLLRTSSRDHLPLSELICDFDRLEKITPALKKNTINKLKNFCTRLTTARRWLSNRSLDRFFNFTIRRFKFLPYCLAQNDPQILNHLLAFYTELKRLSQEKNYNLTQFLRRLQLLSENKLSVTAAPLTADLENSIQMLTVHRAKGLEFEHVFLIKVVDKKWGNNRDYSRLRLPSGILKYDITRENTDVNEDERRLFYVALTRAKSQIYISYSAKTNTNRDQLPSVFISEIDPAKIAALNPPRSLQTEALLKYFPDQEPIATLKGAFAEYLKKYLSTDYQFNVTHLNSYLRCPFCFYHQTILRIPAVKDKFSSLGTAVHHALTFVYQNLNQTKTSCALDSLLQDFEKALQKERLNPADYRESLYRGRQILTEYFNNYKDIFCQQTIPDYDFKSHHLHLNNIPLTGKIDLIEILNDREVNVVDFKTGNPDGKYQELSPAGDYFRQLAFYQLLISLDPEFKNQQVNLGVIDFIQKSKLKNNFIRQEIKITDADVEQLKAQITDVYQHILNLDFDRIGADCPDRLHVHYLLKK